MHDGEHLVVGHGGAVGAGCGEGVADVGRGDDAGLEGDLCGFEAAGVAVSVEAFVVGSTDFGDVGEGGDAGEDTFAVDGVLAHGLPFGVVELAGLVEDGVADAEFADVVEEGGAAEAADGGGVEADMSGDLGREVCDAIAVAGGVGAFGVDDLREGGGDIVEVGFVDDDGAAAGFQSEDGGVDVGRGEGGPEGRVAGCTEEGVDEFGIEPGAAAGLDFGAGGFGSGGGGEDVDNLGEEGDAAVEGDCAAAEALGAALSVPVFIEAADGVGDGGGEAELAGNGGAAVAAGFDEVLDGVAGSADGVDGAADAFGEACARAGVVEDEAEGGALGIGEGFGGALEGAVVGAVKLGDAGGVAAAAEVLEEDGIIEIGKGGFGEPQGAADLEANPAGAKAVAGGLTFGEVECMAEGAEDLGELDGLGRGMGAVERHAGPPQGGWRRVSRLD